MSLPPRPLPNPGPVLAGLYRDICDAYDAGGLGAVTTERPAYYISHPPLRLDIIDPRDGSTAETQGGTRAQLEAWAHRRVAQMREQIATA